MFRLREHSERFIESGRILGFEVPFSVEEVDRACIDTLAANGLSNAYVRPLAWRGAEQLSVSARATTIHVMVAVWEWPNLFGADRLKGIKLGTSQWKRPHPESAPIRAKASGLYMIGTMAKDIAERDGFTDALMLDWRGHVSLRRRGRTSSSSIKGELHTPVPDCFAGRDHAQDGDRAGAQAAVA